MPFIFQVGADNARSLYMTTRELDTENEKINTELKSKTTNFKSQVKLVNEGHSITSFILLKCKTIKLKHFFQYF